MGILLCLVMLCSLLSVTAFADILSGVSFLLDSSDSTKGTIIGVADGYEWGLMEYVPIPASDIDDGNKYVVTGLTAGLTLSVKHNEDAISWPIAKKDAPTSEQYTITLPIDSTPGTITANVDGLQVSFNNGSSWADLPNGTAYPLPTDKNAGKIRTAEVSPSGAGETIYLASDAIDFTFSSVATYPLWVAGVQVTSLKPSGDGWIYHPSTNTLELTGTISVNELGEIAPPKCAAIYYGDTSTLKIAVSADSTVYCAVPEKTESYGIFSNGEVSLISMAEHKLAVYSMAATDTSTAIKCNGLTVDSCVSLEAEAGAAKISTGIDAGFITNNGRVSAKSAEMTFNPYDLSSENYSNAVKINGTIKQDKDTATFSATAGKAYHSQGIEAVLIDISKGSITAVSGVSASASEIPSVSSMAIVANAMEMKGGTLTASAEIGSQTSIGMQLMHPDSAVSYITDGTVSVSGGQAAVVSSGLMITQNVLGISAGSLSASSACSIGTGISGQLAITGSAIVTAEGGDKAFFVAPTINYSPNEAQVFAGAAAPGEKKSAADIANPSTYTGSKYVNISTVIPISGISLNKTTLSLREGTSETLIATITPENATDKTITWSSNNSSVATVDSTTGMITAVKRGVPCTITATTSNGKTASCTVTVTDGVHANKITLDKTSLTVEEGGSADISFVISPEDAVTKAVSVQAMDSSLVSLSNPSSSDTKVTVTGLKAGTTKLLFKSTDPSSTAGTVECAVTVTPKTYVTGIAITDATGNPLSSLSLTTKGSTKQIYAVVTPTTATNKAVEWTYTGNNTIIYLTDKTDTSCVINAYGNGTATVTATAKDGSGKTATINVTVSDTTSSYKFTYKENSGVWYYDSKTYNTFTVKCDGPYTSLQGVLIDGYIIPSSYYTVADGSTIVTFAYPYMSTLSHGRHTLSFVYPGQTVSTYIWSRSLYDPPITGDSGTAGMITALCISALAAGSCGIVLKRKKEN